VLKSAGGGGGGAPVTPGGASGTVQYNNAGSFGGMAAPTAGQVLTGASSGAPTWSSDSQVFGSSAHAAPPPSGSPMVAFQSQQWNISCPGAVQGMCAVANPENDLGDGFVWVAWVSAADTITIRMTCLVAGSFNYQYFSAFAIGH